MKPFMVAAVQYSLTGITDEAAFWQKITATIQEAAGRGADLIVFPEYMTAHLLGFTEEMDHEAACRYLDSYTEDYIALMQKNSREQGLMILGGTHICKENGKFFNKAFLFFPDGRIETQSKLHLTPEEQTRWPLAAGDSLNIVETSWGKLAMLTCYDIEFPELARLAADQGAELLLCPSYTDTSFGYYRVRLCAQARAIENQLFVVLSGIIGELSEDRPQVDRGYCQAGLFTPCDVPFAEDGILETGELNQDMFVMAELDFSMLRTNREQGLVAPFYDRRPDLYKQQENRLLKEC